jgi:hypothetical protein
MCWWPHLWLWSPWDFCWCNIFFFFFSLENLYTIITNKVLYLHCIVTYLSPEGMDRHGHKCLTSELPCLGSTDISQIVPRKIKTVEASNIPPQQEQPCRNFLFSAVQIQFYRLWRIHTNITAHMIGLWWDPLYICHCGKKQSVFAFLCSLLLTVLCWLQTFLSSLLTFHNWLLTFLSSLLTFHNSLLTFLSLLLTFTVCSPPVTPCHLPASCKPPPPTLGRWRQQGLPACLTQLPKGS